MDNEQLSTLIAIGFIVVFSIISLIKDVRKKASERDSRTPAPHVWDERKEQSETTPSSGFLSYDRFQDTPVSTSSETDLSSDEAGGQEDCHTSMNAEDLRRAVIWSEILKTKF